MCSIKDVFELFSYIATSVGILGLFITYLLSKKQVHFNTMEKCLRDFRLIEFESNREKAIKEYIDLVNEEFFYFENDFLPIEVVIEWVDGMIDYLPFYNSDVILKKSVPLQIDSLDDLTGKLISYPRIKKAVFIKSNIDFTKIFPLDNMKQSNRDERYKLVESIILNLHKKNWYCPSFLFKRELKRKIKKVLD